MNNTRAEQSRAGRRGRRSRWSFFSSDERPTHGQSRPPVEDPGAEATASRRALQVEEVLDDHGVLDLEPITRSQRVGAAVGDEVGGCRGGRRQRLKVEVEVEVNPREEVSADGGDGMGHMGGWRIWIRVGRPARLKVWRG